MNKLKKKALKQIRKAVKESGEVERLLTLFDDFDYVKQLSKIIRLRMERMDNCDCD